MKHDGDLDTRAISSASPKGLLTRHWEHETDREEWWSGPAAGLASIGQILISQPPETIREAHRHYTQLSEQFVTAEGRLTLPHAALIASGCA